MSRTDPAGQRPAVDADATAAFSAADVAELRGLIAKNTEAVATAATAAAKAARGRHRTGPPNLGTGLVVVVVVVVLALCALAGVFGWLLIVH